SAVAEPILAQRRVDLDRGAFTARHFRQAWSGDVQSCDLAIDQAFEMPEEITSALRQSHQGGEAFDREAAIAGQGADDEPRVVEPDARQPIAGKVRGGDGLEECRPRIIRRGEEAHSAGRSDEVDLRPFEIEMVDADASGDQRKGAQLRPRLGGMDFQAAVRKSKRDILRLDRRVRKEMGANRSAYAAMR